jgi:sugar phosphate isomerase/epimerase
VRFGISSHLYHEQRLSREHLLEIAEFGFTEVELFATMGHLDYHDPAALDRVGGWLKEAGLQLHSVHAPIVEHVTAGQWGPALSTAAAAEAARAKALAEAVAAAEIARRIPYRYLVVHLGIPTEWASGPEDNSRAAAERSIEALCATAAPLGVQVAVEVIPNRISEAEQLVRMLEEDLELPSPGAGICLDLGHAFMMGDLADAIEIVGGELVTTHVHDNRGKQDEHLVPFEGRIDWPTALMSLQKVGYEGTILFELANTSSPRAVLQKTVEVRKRFEDILAAPLSLEP